MELLELSLFLLASLNMVRWQDHEFLAFRYLDQTLLQKFGVLALNLTLRPEVQVQTRRCLEQGKERYCEVFLGYNLLIGLLIIFVHEWAKAFRRVLRGFKII